MTRRKCFKVMLKEKLMLK